MQTMREIPKAKRPVTLICRHCNKENIYYTENDEQVACLCCGIKIKGSI